jgi:hypothetical protein
VGCEYKKEKYKYSTFRVLALVDEFNGTTIIILH